MRKIFFTAVLLGILGCLCASWGFLIEPNRLKINRYDLKLKNWSPQLNGFKIVAVSDIHAGSNFITEDKIRQIVRDINEQNPDIVFLLGDYVSPLSSKSSDLRMPLRNVAESMRGLQAKFGVFAVLGNTDEQYNAKLVREEMGKIGVTVLSNEITSIEVKNKKLRLLGLADKMISGNWHEISGELKKVLAGDNSSGNIIVLVHNPDYLPVISGDFSISNDISLILAGHTHGGQVRFPFIGAPVIPSEYGQKYAAGYIRDQDNDMFVTTGIGTSTIPVRFGVPPEIAVLTLYAE